MIKVENLKYTYETDDNTVEQALNGVSFHIKQGEWVAICGHNGSGKSTLAKLIDGLLTASQGDIIVDGMTLTDKTVWDVRSKIGMVFQNPDNQFVGVTVEDDVAFGLENKGVPRDEIITKIDDVLALVNMSEFKTKEPARLSGGQKQRVAIASVLALEPKIIILDEATAMLDPKGRQQIMSVVKTLKDKLNLTVISITHDIQEALYADRLLVMQKGNLVYDGIPAPFFEQGNDVKNYGLDVPYAEQIRYGLNQSGVVNINHYMNQEELEEWLCQSLLNK